MLHSAKRKVAVTDTDKRNVASKSSDGASANSNDNNTTGAKVQTQEVPKPKATVIVPVAPSLFAEYDSD